MTDKYWIGAAQAVAQITTITFSAYTSGQSYTLTINNKSVTYTAVASTSADVWAGLVNAWNGASDPELVEAVATVGGSGVVLTSRTAGTPFTVTASATGGITGTVTATRAATGPNSRTNAANWSPSGAPGAGDRLIFRNSAISLLYDLVDTGTNYGDIVVEASFTGNIGLGEKAEGNYVEYRPRYLKLGDGSHTFKVTIGQGSGQNGTRVLIDANTATVNLYVYGTGADQATERPFQIKNTDSSSTAEIYGGYAALLADAGGTASFASLAVIAQPNATNKPTVDVGVGVTITAVTMAGGELRNYGTVTTMNATESAEVHNYAAMPTVKAATRAVVYWESTSAVTTKAIAFNLGTIDFSRNNTTKAVAACDVYAGGSMLDPNGICTFTSSIVLVGAKIGDVTLDVGRGRTIGVS